ncbi:hypothetical protein OPQ81_004133 [Rhizoctonia solani]|nr:hypothetical protein OPQ81_004133 [Rhizoctonia solani]
MVRIGTRDGDSNGWSLVEIVRLGKSGLKVSMITLGTMSYGSPEWQRWVLGEEEGIKHIKLAYEGDPNF